MDEELYTNDVFCEYKENNEPSEEESDCDDESTESSDGEDDWEEHEDTWQEHADENHTKCLKMIYQYVQEGLSRAEIFVRLYIEFHLEHIERSKAESYFNYFDCDAEEFKDLSDIERRLTRRIAVAYARYQNSIAFWSEADLVWETFKILDGRYAISFAGNSAAQSFHLLDSFHGHKREIRIENAHPDFFQLCQFKLEVIDSEFMLLFENRTDHKYFNAFLLSLDLEQAKCRILWRIQKLEGIFKRVIFDSQDRMKFVVQSCNYGSEEINALRFMSVDNVNRRITTSDFAYFNQELRCERLLGSKLQYLKFGVEDNRGPDHRFKKVFGEHDLSPGQKDRSFQELFEVKTETLLYNTSKTSFCWNKNICFILFSPTRICLKSYLYVFDVDTHQIFHLNYFFTYFTMEVHVDENNILTVCDQHPEKMTHYVYRYETNKPDSLVNKTLLWIKRRKDLSSRVSCCLPPHLRPLSICNEIQPPVRNSSRIANKMKLLSLDQQQTEPTTKRQKKK